MKVSIERSALLSALGHIQSIVERRSTLQILSNVKLVARDDVLTLSATDMDVETVETVGAKALLDGATTAPAHMLHDIVRKLPEGAEVLLEAGGEDPRLRLTSGRSEFFLSVLPAQDFPALSAGDLTHTFQLGSQDLKRLFDKTKFAISTEETRYYLNGVYLHVVEGETPLLRAVATDGHRLARLEMPAPAGAQGVAGVIVPRKTALEIVRLMGESEDAVEIGLSQTKLQIRVGTLTLTSKLIDGTFPDYERVIPKTNGRVLKAPVGGFRGAVDRVSSISLDKTRAVKLAIEADRLMLTVTNPESGSAVEELSVDYQAEPLEIGFNSRYLLDIMGEIDGEEARFSMADPGAPMVVEDQEDANAVYVLMPMRV